MSEMSITMLCLSVNFMKYFNMELQQDKTVTYYVNQYYIQSCQILYIKLSRFKAMFKLKVKKESIF